MGGHHSDGRAKEGREIKHGRDFSIIIFWTERVSLFILERESDRSTSSPFIGFFFSDGFELESRSRICKWRLRAVRQPYKVALQEGWGRSKRDIFRSQLGWQ